MARILIVDDDPHIRELIRRQIIGAGHEAVTAADGEEALERLDSVSVDLAILDVMMPKIDGWDLCKSLKRHFGFPILMLTAKGDTSQKVKGLDLGADDYVVKPYQAPELIARVKALLRRYKIEMSQRVTIGNVVIDRENREITMGGSRLTVPPREFDLLFKLASFPGRTFTRDQLIDDLWGPDFDGTERTVDVHINRLRERFPEGESGFRISAMRGLGYRLEDDHESTET